MTYAIVNTKGGAGKTICSTMVIPALFIGSNKEIKIYELDNNNKTTLPKSVLSFETLRADEGKDKIYEISFDEIAGQDCINIIDAGGGGDTLSVLSHLRAAKIEDVTYVIPANDDIEQVKNVKETIREIRAYDEDAKIFIVLNRCTSMVAEKIKEQFLGFFGSEKYGISPSMGDKEFKKVEFLFLPASPIFGILKNIYGLTIYDLYPTAKDVVDNFSTLRKEWAKEGKEAYMKQLQFKEFATDLVELVDTLGSVSPLKGD